MTKARFRAVDIFADDDPAITLMREALAARQAAQNAPERPEADPVVPVDVPAPFTRRERIAQLLARVRAGDLSAANMLRDLLEDRR